MAKIGFYRIEDTSNEFAAEHTQIYEEFELVNPNTISYKLESVIFNGREPNIDPITVKRAETYKRQNG